MWRFNLPSKNSTRFAACLMGLGMITLTGEIVPGVECPTLQTDTGEKVALSHIVGPFRIGDRVTVTGTGYGGSMSCQQTVFLVTGTKPAD